MPRTIDQICEQTGVAPEEIAERSQLTVARVIAIIAGRWTPSPKERERIAKALDVKVEDVSWGHTMAPRVVRYHQHGFPENF